jgi:hypothetical protein
MWCYNKTQYQSNAYAIYLALHCSYNYFSDIYFHEIRPNPLDKRATYLSNKPVFQNTFWQNAFAHARS